MKFQLRKYLVLVALLFLQNSFPQEITDSVYNAATMNVYDEPEKAIEQGIRMYETSSRLKQKINALLLLSTAYSSKREYEKSLDYALRAIELSKKSNDTRSQIQVLNKIAAQYHQLGINDKALQYLDESEQIIAGYPHKDSIRLILGNNYGVRGFIYRDQLNCDIAIDYFNRSLNQFKTESGDPKMVANMSVITYNKGNCFITLTQYDSARINFDKSLDFAVKVEAKSLEAFARKGLAEVFTIRGEYEEAIAQLNQAMEVSRNVGDLVLNQGLYKGLADNYLAINQWDNYQEYYEKYLRTETQNKREERKTISISLAKHSEETHRKIHKLKSCYGTGIFISALIILVLILFILYGQIRFNRRFRALKQQLKPTEEIKQVKP